MLGCSVCGGVFAAGRKVDGPVHECLYAVRCYKKLSARRNVGRCAFCPLVCGKLRVDCNVFRAGVERDGASHIFVKGDCNRIYAGGYVGI